MNIAYFFEGSFRIELLVANIAKIAVKICVATLPSQIYNLRRKRQCRNNGESIWL
jgi:hypothetical protein